MHLTQRTWTQSIRRHSGREHKRPESQPEPHSARTSSRGRRRRASRWRKFSKYRKVSTQISVNNSISSHILGVNKASEHRPRSQSKNERNFRGNVWRRSLNKLRYRRGRKSQEKAEFGYGIERVNECLRREQFKAESHAARFVYSA